MTKLILAQSGTTLFHVGAKFFGNALLWSRIALVNDVQDPYLSNSLTLKIPMFLTKSRSEFDR
jgi:hypothetical protein